MSDLRNLKNIGKTLAARLDEIGVHTPQELNRLGAPEAHRRIQKNHADQKLPVCYYLYSLEGAIQEKDWREFTEAEKAAMRSFIDPCGQ